jgi:hypothetical protein
MNFNANFKTIFICIIALSALNTGAAQGFCDQLSMLKEGYEAEYTSYDAKNKIVGKQRIQVIEVKRDGAAVLSKVKSVFYDKKEKETNTFEMEYRCEGDIFYIDLSNQLDPQMLASLGSSMEVEIKGVPSAYPSSLKVGDKLPDADMELEARSGTMRILSMRIKNTNQLVEKKELIKTDAGEFDCFKIIGDSEVKAIFRENTKTENYFNPKAGVVKSVSYDKKGKLRSTSLLTAVKY